MQEVSINDENFKQFINSKLVFKFISETTVGDKHKKHIKEEICEGIFVLD